MSEAFIPSTNEIVELNRRFAADFAAGGVRSAPRRRMAIVTCMDARIDVFAVLGLDYGDAHVIRNAGGVVTDDVIRSLCLSQRMLGTREIVVVHHTDCGLQGIDEATFRADIASEIGVKPPWSVEAFDDPYDDVRQSIQRLYMAPFVAHKADIRGFVYDVETGLLDEVSLAPREP